MRAWAIAIALGLAACGDDLATYDDVVVHGEHVDLWYASANAPCGGTLAWLDGLVAREDALFGFAADDARGRIEYHYRPRGTPLPCPDGANGCTYLDSTTVYAQPPDFAHEVTHAVLYTHGLEPASFFDEGLATALGGPEDADDPIDYAVDLDRLLGAQQLPFDGFTTAGDLISWLVATRGPATYVELLRRTHNGDPAAIVRAAFRDVYGESIDDAIAERRADPVVYPEGRMHFPMCSLDPAPDGVIDLRLDRDDGVGPIFASYPPMMRAFATLDVPVAGDYTVSGHSDALGIAILYSCDGGTQRAFVRGSPASTQVTLPAGRLYVEMATYVANPSTIHVELSPSGGLR